METYQFPEVEISSVTLRTAVDNQPPIEYPEIGQIIELGGDVDGGFVEFRVFVGSQNVDEDLQARWRIVRGVDGAQVSLQSTCGPEPAFEEPVVPADGNLERGFKFSIPRGQFAQAGCYAVELAVSPEFLVNCNFVINGAQTLFDQPAVGNPVAVARWYLVAEGRVDDCPRQTLAEMVQ